MKKHVIYCIIFLSIIILSCEKDFETDNQMIVLHSLVFEGQSPKIILSQSLDPFPTYPFNIKYFDQPFTIEGYYSNIDITVSCEGVIYDNFKMEYQEIKQTQYYVTPYATEYIKFFIDSSFIPEAGKEYEINIVEIPNEYGMELGFDYVKSKTYIPEKIPVIIEQQPDIAQPMTEYWGDTTIYIHVYNISFNDPPDNDDYYYLCLSKVGCTNYFSMDTINMDELWLNKYSYDFEYNDVWIMPLDYFQGNKVSGINTGTGNISYLMGFNGFFFKDEDVNGLIKTIRLELINYLDETNSTQYLVAELLHITKEYYDYYTAFSKQHNSQFDIYAEPTQLFTNIENGIGVFAGASLSSSNLLIQDNPE